MEPPTGTRSGEPCVSCGEPVAKPSPILVELPEQAGRPPFLVLTVHAECRERATTALSLLDWGELAHTDREVQDELRGLSEQLKLQTAEMRTLEISALEQWFEWDGDA